MTKNYTGAEIEAVVKSAASFAFFRGKDISDFAKTATITERMGFRLNKWRHWF